MILRCIFAIVFLGVSAANGDTLTDLRVALAALRGTAPVHASVQIQRSRKSSGRFANQSIAGRAEVDIGEDASGFRIAFPAEVIARAARESHEHETDPKKQTPTRMVLDETQPTELADLLDFAGSVLDMLAIGERTGERRVTRDGRPVRLLTLKLTPKLPPEATSVWHVRFSEDRLDIWIGDDNLPVAASRVRRGSAGFLFLRGEMSRSDSWTFIHIGDRLVITRLESSFAASGLGQHGDGRNVETLTLR